jgi:hypothetical protein
MANVKAQMVKTGRVLASLLMVGALGGLHLSVSAQRAPSTQTADQGLPSAPDSGSLTQQSSQTSNLNQSLASINGIVLDPSGAAVRGARVSLAEQQGETGQVAITDDQGRFIFSDLPAGNFRVSVSSTGLATFVSDAVTLTAGQKLELPPIALHITGASSEVRVEASQKEIAQAQIQAQEKQRVLGIVPNFYSSYIWNAAPMTSQQKFGLAVRSTTDPVAFMVAGGVAGVEQWHNTFPGYGRGTDGYLKRFGAAYADNVIGRMVGSAMLPSIFHQDPRYFYKGSGSITSRALYAISQTVVCRGDDGRSEPNYSHVLGNFAAAGISNLYRSPEDRSASLTIRNGFIITGSNAVGNLVREFILRKLTPKVPDYARGKP